MPFCVIPLSVIPLSVMPFCYTFSVLAIAVRAHDIWCIKQLSNVVQFYLESNRTIGLFMTRLLVNLSGCVTKVDIIPTIVTEFQGTDDMARRPGIWKLNISLLNDDKYVVEIDQLIPTVFNRNRLLSERTL